MARANEAVAEHFHHNEFRSLRGGVPPGPTEEKLDAFAHFPNLLGHPIRAAGPFELAAVLSETRRQAGAAAVHYRPTAEPEAARTSPVQDPALRPATTELTATSPRPSAATGPRRPPLLTLIKHRMASAAERAGGAPATLREDGAAVLEGPSSEL